MEIKDSENQEKLLTLNIKLINNNIYKIQINKSECVGNLKTMIQNVIKLCNNKRLYKFPLLAKDCYIQVDN